MASFHPNTFVVAHSVPFFKRLLITLFCMYTFSLDLSEPFQCTLEFTLVDLDLLAYSVCVTGLLWVIGH